MEFRRVGTVLREEVRRVGIARRNENINQINKKETYKGRKVNARGNRD